MTYELTTQYDARKSFYGKATVEHNEVYGLKLISYSTHVASIKNDTAKVYGSFSQTTLRHIKEFLKQNGFKAESSKQILADYFDK